MRQIMHIRGGDAFDTYDEYWQLLKRWKIGDPAELRPNTWTKRYDETLGESWQLIKPDMPSPLNAKYEEWKLWFEKYVPYLHNGVTLVGYSLGGVFLAKYLSENAFPVRVASLHLVAAPFGRVGDFLMGNTLGKIEEQCSPIYIYHSKDDPIVSYQDAERYREALPSAELVAFKDRGHFFQEEFPELIANITKNAQ